MLGSVDDGSLFVAFAVYNAASQLDASHMLEISAEIITGIDIYSSQKGIDGWGDGIHKCTEEELRAFKED